MNHTTPDTSSNQELPFKQRIGEKDKLTNRREYV